MKNKQPSRAKNLPKRRGKVFCDRLLINKQLKGE
jgi:hypothetical protein